MTTQTEVSLLPTRGSATELSKNHSQTSIISNTRLNTTASTEELKTKTVELVKVASAINKSLSELRVVAEPSQPGSNIQTITTGSDKDTKPVNNTKTSNRNAIFSNDVPSDFGSSTSRQSSRKPCPLPHIDEEYLASINNKIKDLESQKTKIKQIDTENAHLRNMIQSLHGEMSGGQAKQDLLQRQVVDLQMKLSRQNMELKSVQDQNGILRKENKRVLEEGNEQTRRIDELQSALDRAIREKEYLKSQRDDVYDFAASEAIKGRLYEWIDTELKRCDEKMNEWGHGLRPISPKDSVSRKYHTHLSIVLETFNSSLKHLREMVHTLPTDVTMIDFHTIMGKITTFYTTLLQSIIGEVSVMESRLHQLQVESRIHNIESRSPSPVTTNLQRQLDDALEKLADTERHWRNKTDTASSEVSQLAHQNRVLQSRVNELEMENESLYARFLRRNRSSISPAVSPRAFSPELSVNANLMIQVEDLTLANQRLQKHIETLEDNIEEWKSENEHLRRTVTRLQDEPIQQSETQTVLIESKYRAVVADLENKVEDSKLSNKKKEELIKTLNDDLELAHHQIRNLREQNHSLLQNVANGETGAVRSSSPLPTTNSGTKGLDTAMNEVLSTLQQRIHSLNSNADPFQSPTAMATAFSSLNDHDFDRFVTVWKESQETSEMLGKLKGSLEEYMTKSKDLQKQNDQLQKSVEKSQARSEAKDKEWRTKFVKVQQELTTAREAFTELNSVLTNYELQYQKILAHQHQFESVSSGSSTTVSHPLAFDKVFEALYNTYNATSHSMKQLSAKMSEANRSITNQSIQIDALTREYKDKVSLNEALEKGMCKLREEMALDYEKQRKHYEHQLANKEREVGLKQKELECMERENEKLSGKLKKVVLGCQSMFGKAM